MKLRIKLVMLLVLTTALGGEAQIIKSLRTSALNSLLWREAEWISAADAPVVTGQVVDGSRAADGASWFATSIKNEKKVASAQWMTTALGVYDLYVNGTLVGEEILKPGFTHYEKTRRSFTYDVTKLINQKSGKTNTLCVQVTPGWWADKIITPGGNEGMIGKKCAFRGVLQLTFTDGTTAVYGTNTTDWKAKVTGPVKHADIFDGIEYDARIELPVWNTNVIDGRAELNQEFHGEILPSEGAEIYLRKDLALKPIRSYVWKDIEGASDANYGRVKIEREYNGRTPITLHAGENLVIDFGQNCAAVPNFFFDARTGTKLTCLPGELLNDGNGAKSRGMDGPEGSVHRLNLRIPEEGMRIEYTFGRPGFETFTPTCTFFGYRFVTITATDDVTINSIESIPVTSIAQNLETGFISTGNDEINKLISNTIWGQRSNYLSVPTDCPQRNERLGWTADTQVFTATGTFFANTSHFFHKWMRDMRDTQSPEGGFPGVAPLAQYGGEMNRVGWADAGVIVPWTIWKQFGDKMMIDESWLSMERFMKRINETKYDHKALLSDNGNYQWADWLSYEPLESCSGRAFGPDGPLPEAVEYWNYLNASYWLMDAQMMIDMARATGRDSQKYEQMAKDARQYILERFFNADATFKLDILNTMQTPALFALKNQILSGSQKEALILRLRKNFLSHDNCLQTGFLGTSILMGTLTDNGMSDIAYELLLQHKNPSWLYSIDNGATTIWERWNSYMIDEGMGPQGMNSFNHYAYGAVCQWLWESAAGICADVNNPGFKHIIMKPIPDRRLGHLDAEYHSAAGVIKSSWRYEGDEWIWTFTIPEGSTATVVLPGELEGKEYPSGTYTLQSTLIDLH